jgi:hypothetical protein
MSKTHDVGVAVEAELAFDPLVDDWNITVVHLKGDVSLHGTVASYPEYVEAEAATRAPVLDARGSLRFPSAGGVRRQPRGNRDARWHRRHASTTAMLVVHRSNQSAGE